MDIHLSYRLVRTLCPLFQVWYTLIFYRNALKGLRGLPLLGSLRMISLGFLPDKQVTYGLGRWPSRQRAKLFVTDVHRVRLPHRSPERVRDRVLYVDKVRFAELVTGFADTPKILAVIEFGRLFSTSTGVPTCDVDGLIHAVRIHGELVIKPRDGSGGHGVSFFRASEGRLWLDREAVSPSVLEERIRQLDSYIVTTRIQQARYAAELFGKTTNTIRLLTMIDPKSGEAFVATAAQRIGSEASFPTDNTSSGGLLSNIDLESGRLSIAVRKDGSRHKRHPDSGAQIEGVVIPGWTDLMDSLRRLAQKLDFLEYIGWDLVVTEDGFSIIEGNGNSTFSRIQIHTPLLADERTRSFYQYHLASRKKRKIVGGQSAACCSGDRQGKIHMAPLVSSRRFNSFLPVFRTWYVLRLIPSSFKQLKGLPLIGSLRMMALGFTPDKQVTYGLGSRPSREKARLFLSDVQRRRMLYTSTNRVCCRRLLDDKARFTELVQGFADTPKLLAVIQSGRLFPVSTDVASPDIEGLSAAARTHGALVLKPRVGTQGEGVSLLSYSKGRLCFDREPVSSGDFEERIRRLDSYIVTPRVQQARYAEEFFGKTTNTIRVVTMIDPKNREAFVATAVQRIGIEASLPTDNVSRGGLLSNIDLESGRLSIAVTKDGSRYRRHPDSGAQIEGFVIPGWTELMSSLQRLAQRLDFLEYVGWDLVVTDEGFSVIEGNYSPGFGPVQMNGPLLADERVRRFYSHHLSFGKRRAARKTGIISDDGNV